MSAPQLKYGKTALSLPLLSQNDLVVEPAGINEPLSSEELERELDHPLATPPLEELARPASSVLIVVSDATRNARTDILLPLVLQRLHKGNISSKDIAVIFARGNHREVTPAEMADILGGSLSEDIRIFQHDSSDSSMLRSCGITSRGIEIQLNRLIFEYDLLITISAVSSHYFAGFGGGRKSIFPGLGGKEAIIKNHLLSVDFQKAIMAEGVEPARLKGNRIHEDFIEIVNTRPPDFSINVIVSEKKQIGKIFSGHWLDSHEAACKEYLDIYGVRLPEKAPAAIASCGGFPKDIDLIQSLKTIQYASRALKKGGKLLVLAQCADGLGSEVFDSYFPITNIAEFLEKLATGTLKNGQTAIALREKVKDFKIGMISQLPDKLLSDMGITPIKDINTGLTWLQEDFPETTYIFPQGALTLPLL